MYKYRILSEVVQDRLKAFRVVSLTGARQVGKTTLAKAVAKERGMHYVSLEDPVARAAAADDADQWLAANPSPLVIDEIQHVPDLFRAIKRRVDDDSRRGQYLITGSALWLSMKSIGESLAGRVAILELWPFRLAEWRQSSPFDFALLCGRTLDLDAVRRALPRKRRRENWLGDAVLMGGFPELAELDSPAQRKTWAESYLSTYLQRDVLDFTKIEHVTEYSRLVRLLASRTGRLLNISSISRELGLPQPTVRRYADWLRITYQRYEIPPYSANLGKRLVKTPKTFWVDTGVAAALLGIKTRQDLEGLELMGPFVETWVGGEIMKWAAAGGGAPVFFWRSHGGSEVDFLLEIEGEVVGIEVKTGHRINRRELAGLSECRNLLKKRFRRGVVLYGGDEVVPVDESIVAVPLSALGG